MYTAAIAAVFSAWQLIVWEKSATRHLDAVLQMPGRGRHLAMKQHARFGAQRVLALLAQIDRQQMTLNGSRAALIVHSRWYRTVLDGALCLLHSRVARSTVKHLLHHWAGRASTASRVRLQANHMAMSKLRGVQRMAFHGWQNMVSNSRWNQAVLAVILTRPAFRHRKPTLRVTFTAWAGWAVWYTGALRKDGQSLQHFREFRTSITSSGLQAQRKRTLYEAIHTPSSSSPSPIPDSKETSWSLGIASRQLLVHKTSDPSEPLIASALAGQQFRLARLSSTPSSLRSSVSRTSENRSLGLQNADTLISSTTTVLAEVLAEASVGCHNQNEDNHISLSCQRDDNANLNGEDLLKPDRLLNRSKVRGLSRVEKTRGNELDPVVTLSQREKQASNVGRQCDDGSAPSVRAQARTSSRSWSVTDHDRLPAYTLQRG